MKLFSYVVARDYGFAPNPFFGICTLATCKPKIRKKADVGDWIVGTGSKQKGRQGFLVYVMQVTGTMTFNEYWGDARFRLKKPNLVGSEKQAFGDNIYFRGQDGQWNQQNSHHSCGDGTPNPHNIHHDTKVDRVLTGERYIYYGGSEQKIPREFINHESNICAVRNHRSNFPAELVENFVEWIESLDANGRYGEPLDW